MPIRALIHKRKEQLAQLVWIQVLRDIDAHIGLANLLKVDVQLVHVRQVVSDPKVLNLVPRVIVVPNGNPCTKEYDWNAVWIAEVLQNHEGPNEHQEHSKHVVSRQDGIGHESKSNDQKQPIPKV